MKTKDIMHKRLITASPEMTLKELASLFIHHGITGAPVVDLEGRLLGVVSQTDLVRHERDVAPPEVSSYYIEPEELSIRKGFHVEAPDDTRVKDVMTPKVITFDERAPVKDIARLMLDKRIHRVLITRHGKLCGIVTTMDMLKVLLDLTARWEEEAIPS